MLFRSFLSDSSVELSIPDGWAAPSSVPGAGQVSVSAGTCILSGAPPFDILGQVITVHLTSCLAGHSFSITYAGAPAADVTGQAYIFRTRTNIGPGATHDLQVIAASPGILVTPMPVTITPNPGQGKIYGEPEPVFGYTHTALIGADAISGNLGRISGNQFDNVGVYAYTLGNATAGGNYSLSLGAGGFSITARPIRVVAIPGLSKVVGEADPIFGYSKPSLVSNDQYSGLLSRSPGESVGFYPINRGTLIAGRNDGKNYAINFVSAQFEIKPNAEHADVFADVPLGSFAWEQITLIYNLGITSGCSGAPLRYCPDASVTRAQMAVFLLRARGVSAPTPATGQVFTDVPADYWAANWIEELSRLGITTGCDKSRYCPDDIVTRAQMAVFLLRARADAPANFNPPPADASIFQDVPADFWAVNWINELFHQGITSGCTANTYCPEDPVTRAQMAIFLVRAFNLLSTP